jgi:hypothetical protein
MLLYLLEFDKEEKSRNILTIYFRGEGDFLKANLHPLGKFLMFLYTTGLGSMLDLVVWGGHVVEISSKQILPPRNLICFLAKE